MSRCPMRVSQLSKVLIAPLLLTSLMSVPVVAQTGDAVKGKKAFRSCRVCHKVGEKAKNSVGPVLNGIVGRPAGSFEGYRYSKALKAANTAGLKWTTEALFAWLANPKEYMRGYLKDDSATVKMPFKISDEQKRRDIIAYLGTLSVAAKAESKKTGDVTHGKTPFDPKLGAATVNSSPALEGMQRVRQKLVQPPFAPAHSQVAEGAPKVIEIELVVEEKKWVLDGAGTEIYGLTFNGSIPGPLIVAHQNDYVEVTLKNPSTNVMEHNIDLHAATGALGGAALTTISPGEEAVLRFKATKAGVFLYHCAPEGSMTPYHVTHGMTGAIMVLPRDGLKDAKGKSLRYDKLYYVGENEFYVPRDEKGNFKKYDSVGADLDDWLKSMRGLIPSHVVFNGRVGALTGKGAMKAKVGDNVLFLHVQGNRDTRPHLIGGHGDFVWETGSFSSPPQRDLETWFVRGGSAGAALYKFCQPGIYAYLNHNLIEAVELGAAGHVVVEGKWNDSLMKQVYVGPLRK